MPGGIPELEAYLKAAEIDSISVWPYPGTRKSYQIVFVGGVDVIAKTTDEPPATEEECKREVAGWIVARDLGWPHLVGVTVFRDMPSQVKAGTNTKASMQVAWPKNEKGENRKAFTEQEAWRAGVFDGLVAHGDRHGGNYLFCPPVPSGVTPRLKLVDHGIGFMDVETPSPFYRDRRDSPIPDEYMDGIKRLRSSFPGELAEFLSGPELANLERRLDRLLQSSRLNVT